MNIPPGERLAENSLRKPLKRSNLNCTRVSRGTRRESRGTVPGSIMNGSTPDGRPDDLRRKGAAGPLGEVARMIPTCTAQWAYRGESARKTKSGERPQPVPA